MSIPASLRPSQNTTKKTEKEPVLSTYPINPNTTQSTLLRSWLLSMSWSLHRRSRVRRILQSLLNLTCSYPVRPGCTTQRHAFRRFYYSICISLSHRSLPIYSRLPMRVTKDAQRSKSSQYYYTMEKKSIGLEPSQWQRILYGNRMADSI